jgi:hypothetical protein
MMAARIFFAVFVVCIVSIGGIAQKGDDPDNWCRAGFFTRESDDFQIGIVKLPAKQRAYFYNDDESDCPENERCRAKAYLVSGDQVIVAKTRGKYSCAWYTPAKGYATVGWLKTENLRLPEMIHDVSPKAWIGEYNYGDNSISFTHNKLAGWLNVTGNAFWKGLGDNIHIGELDGRVEPNDGMAVYSDGEDEYDCKAAMRLIGNFLIVNDNMRCGGANVTFSGVYIKKAAKGRTK